MAKQAEMMSVTLYFGKITLSAADLSKLYLPLSVT